MIMFLLGLFIMMTTGCAGLVLGGAAAGSASGTYFWINGEMKTDYYTSFDKVWAAAEKTVADMKGVDVEPNKEIAQGTILTLINDKKVTISIQYKDKNQTSVSIRVGMVGDTLSSRRLHDKLAENLALK
jgi:ABC-type sugar transport system substrate-binding protein